MNPTIQLSNAEFHLVPISNKSPQSQLPPSPTLHPPKPTLPYTLPPPNPLLPHTFSPKFDPLHPPLLQDPVDLDLLRRTKASQRPFWLFTQKSGTTMSNPKDSIFSRSLGDPEIIEFNTKILKYEENLALKGEKYRKYETLRQSSRLAAVLSEQVEESQNLFTAEQLKWFSDDDGTVETIIRQAPDMCISGRFIEIAMNALRAGGFGAEPGLLLKPQEVNVRRHWRDPYFGDTAKAFLNALAERQAKSNIYAKYLHVVQSSGAGKSRMIKECGNTVFTAVFVLRNDSQMGFPPADPEIRHFLTRPVANEYEAHAKAIGFLKAVFENARKLIDDELKPHSIQETPRLWNNALEPPQPSQHEDGKLFPRSTAKVGFCRTTAKDAEAHCRQIIDERKADTAKDLRLSPEEYWTQRMQRYLSKPWGDLKCKMPQNENAPQFILALDEAAELLRSGAATFTALRRILSTMVEYNFWTVFLSTNGQIEVVTRTDTEQPSIRIQMHQLGRPRAYCAFPMDIHEDMQLRNGEADLRESLETLATVNHVIGFGRPLWMLCHEHSPKSARDFVTMKLLGGVMDCEPTKTDHAFALIANRICLQPSMNDKTSYEVAVKSVDLHLRLLTAVHNNPGTISTTTPSEPIVADAAFHLLGRPDWWQKALTQVINDLFIHGRIEKGAIGELFSRLLVILAQDAALKNWVSTTEGGMVHESGQYVPSCLPVSALSFLSELFGRAELDRAIDLAYRNLNNPTTPKGKGVRKGTTQDSDFKKYLLECYTNFNHITQTTERLGPETSAQLMSSLIRRHAALQLTFNEPDWDLLIPMYHAQSISDPYSPEKASPILIQVKNREKAEPAFMSNQQRRLFPNKQNYYVHIHLELENTERSLTAHIDRAPDGSHTLVITAKGHTIFPPLKNLNLTPVAVRLLRTTDAQKTKEESILERIRTFNITPRLLPNTIWQNVRKPLPEPANVPDAQTKQSSEDDVEMSNA